ncbi:hypothetical protein [Microbacterium sp. BK668]|uniref:hypothetical protein n=1 Tax=Microbacterium sp. BK668 TaxID=2512118 RepID=UPI00105B3062|nr:hypothetical protein [Microbacterium sp. BK668]TDN92120.1 hypothetical protein EV279_1633 [Microbacterium sp. BK668]
MDSTATTTRSTRWWRAVWDRPMTAVGAIVIGAAIASVFAPDLVTGSQHEHLPLVALTIWPWAAAAVGYVLMAGRRGPARQLVAGVSVIWAAVAVVAVAVPPIVTGTDPTRIPLAALIVAPFGAVVTGFLAISHAMAGDRAAP